jgi:hypothetical protein
VSTCKQPATAYVRFSVPRLPRASTRMKFTFVEARAIRGVPLARSSRRHELHRCWGLTAARRGVERRLARRVRAGVSDRAGGVFASGIASGLLMMPPFIRDVLTRQSWMVDLGKASSSMGDRIRP